jgi:hypothetical protein
VVRQVVREIVQICQQELPNLDEAGLVARAEEFVVIYGVGCKRQILPDSDDWEGRWPLALERVTREVHRWLRKTASWLYFEVRLEGYAFTAPFPTWIEAEGIAHRLVQGFCDCWHLRYPDANHPPTRNAEKRAARCLREHHLSAWKPTQMTLWNFIARATKGDRPAGSHGHQQDFASGAVEQGMFFYDLYHDHNVRFGNVLGWCCPHHPKELSEGPKCFACEEQGRTMILDDETQYRCNVKRRLLVEAPTGRYYKDVYWHCQKCGNYYAKQHLICPLYICKGSRTSGAAPSTVWVLRARPKTGGVKGDQETGPIVPVSITGDRLVNGGPLSLDDILAIRTAIERLPIQLQKVVEMTFWNKMSLPEIAQELGDPLRKVKGCYKKAIQQLRAFLGNEFFDDGE